MRKAASRANGNALYEAGLMYDLGIYTNKDVTQAVAIVSACVEAGQFISMERLGRALPERQWRRKESRKGLHWIRQATAGGHPFGLSYLGLSLYGRLVCRLTVPWTTYNRTCGCSAPLTMVMRKRCSS